MLYKYPLYFTLILSLLVSSCTYTFYKTACDYPVTGHVTKISPISDALNETSGLETLGNNFVSFNDSGGEPVLYFFKNQNILHKTIIGNTFNADWEDIAMDSRYCYIADVGNNNGSRDTLTIYKVSLDNLHSGNRAEGVQRITFRYDEETSLSTSGMYSHDCEALIVYKDSLYLFAKDWVKMSTRVYVLPASEGHYNIRSYRTYQVNALITGADIDTKNKEIVLSGYRRGYPVMIKYSFESNPGEISCGGKVRKYFKLAGTQVEGVSYGNDGLIYFTSEKRVFKQALYRAY